METVLIVHLVSSILPDAINSIGFSELPPNEGRIVNAADCRS